MNPKVKTWLSLAEDDLEFAGEVLANKKRPHYAAHLCQQSIEKLLKAIVQHKTDTIPNRTHNFVNLCEQAKIELPQDKMEWLLDLAPHYLGTRYPEDLAKLHEKYSQGFSEKLYRETKEFFQWLKETYLK
ncbi:MAG: HEPN domain-containing protein [Deltaproteobacteria bacterium]|nr:HEPN domain-containing protein [Deltaproteobacteria bacterium]